MNKYIFGPVPSRRLGRSLGVDLVPYKTCSFDCIFCQLGKTTNKTLCRKEYIIIDEVIEELDKWLKEEGKVDFITLSGSGEPTLNNKFAKVLEFIKKSTSIPSAVLTNGSTLVFPDVIEGLILADVVKISLSCFDQNSFIKVNRPYKELKFEELVESFIRFRNFFKGHLWIEVFLIEGINDDEEDVKKIAKFIEKIKPDKIHLNTAVRPTAESSVKRVSEDKLNKLSYLFSPKAEVIAEFSPKNRSNFFVDEKRILNMLKRRPCTIDQISKVLGIKKSETLKYLELLARNQKIKPIRKGKDVYYRLKD